MKSRVSSASYKKALQSISSMTRKVVEGQNSKMDKATVEAVYHAMNTADLADAAFADLIAVMDHFCENPVIVFKCLKLIYILLELDHLRFFEIAQNFLPDIETIEGVTRSVIQFLRERPGLYEWFTRKINQLILT